MYFQFFTKSSLAFGAKIDLLAAAAEAGVSGGPEALAESPWNKMEVNQDCQNRYKWIFFEPTCDCHKRKFAFSLDAYPFCQLYKLYIIHMKYRQGK